MIKLFNMYDNFHFLKLISFNILDSIIPENLDSYIFTITETEEHKNYIKFIFENTYYGIYVISIEYDFIKNILYINKVKTKKGLI